MTYDMPPTPPPADAPPAEPETTALPTTPPPTEDAPAPARRGVVPLGRYTGPPYGSNPNRGRAGSGAVDVPDAELDDAS